MHILDVASGDVRTEGMSYGMMIAVQMNKKEEFDRLSRPAADGEIWFATALLIAAHRWGNKRGIFNYHNEAQHILDIMIHKVDTSGYISRSMLIVCCLCAHVAGCMMLFRCCNG